MAANVEVAPRYTPPNKRCVCKQSPTYDRAPGQPGFHNSACCREQQGTPTPDLQNQALNIEPKSSAGSGHERYRDPEERIASFNNGWKEDCPVEKTELAKAGFFFTGDGDKVKCAYCEGGMFNWEGGDTAMGEHSKHFPNCPFVNANNDEFLKSASVTKRKRKPHSDSIKAVIDSGLEEKNVLRAAKHVRQKGVEITTDNLLDVLNRMNLLNLNENSQSNNIESNNSPRGQVRGSTSQLNNNTERTLSHAECDIERDGEVENIFHRREQALVQMKQESQKIKHSFTCRVCLEETVGELFLPCRHLACCVTCSTGVNRCPICRQKIVATIKVFVSV